MTKKIFNEKFWVTSEEEFTFSESVNPKNGEKGVIIKGLLLPFGKVSRNNVLYNKESIREKHKELVGRPVMYNHKTDDDSMPLGHFTKSYIIENNKVPGWYYEMDLDPHDKRDAVRKIKRGDLRHVSVQLIGGEVVERLNEGGNRYSEAYVSDVIEASVVPCPGFLETTTSFAEKFGWTEDMTTATASGSTATLLKGADNKKESDDEEDEEIVKEAEDLVKNMSKSELQELFLNNL